MYERLEGAVSRERVSIQVFSAQSTGIDLLCKSRYPWLGQRSGLLGKPSGMRGFSDDATIVLKYGE